MRRLEGSRDEITEALLLHRSFAPALPRRAAQDEVGRLELPLVDVRIPRVPRHDRRHPLPQIRWDHLGDDERLLPPQLVRIAELEAEDAEDVAGDVPGGLRVPAVGYL